MNDELYFWQRTSIGLLKGIGAATALKLNRLGLHRLQDALFHLPHRYQDRTRLHPIGSAQPFQEVLIQGTVELADIVMRKRRSLIVQVSDGTGMIQLRFFHFSAAQKNSLKPGTLIRCFGEVRHTSLGREMVHPEYTTLKSADVPIEQALTPIFPATEGVGQALLRKISLQVIGLIDRHPVPELIPYELRSKHHWPELGDALKFVHQPPPNVNVSALENRTHAYQQRLAAEELLAHHLSLLKLRAAIQKTGSWPMPPSIRFQAQLLALLPFKPTSAQLRVIEEIAQDLSLDKPMLRLVQGDVGSGKTLVAAMAAIQAIEAGFQVALMAPTEILAEQHYENFQEWLNPLGLKVAWLSGKLKGKKRNEQLNPIRSGEAQMVVGTHALFQEDVSFSNLALAIIDEQHRFGVHQRLALKQKGGDGIRTPHQLIMTATPIPRTLAMSAYADLDTSIIDELPPGRKPVKTVVIENSRRTDVVARVANACSEGKQVYWVCTLIEESEALQCQAAEDAAKDLTLALPNVRVGLVHGRMKAAEKAQVMAAFKAHELQVLVATTVIEVGVNVPNASVMIIENPERLGLAQLHQLRGRVGRGSTESFCLLLYQKPLSQQGKARLNIMRETNDGFLIAEEDLALRGPGEVLGTRQTGEIDFRIADLIRDEQLLENCKQMAASIANLHPEFIQPLIERWMGNKTDYGQV